MFSLHLNAWFDFSYRDFDAVRESMHSAISLNKAEVLDVVLDDFSEVRLNG